MSDVSKVERILLNLVENAAKYAPDGPIELLATASATRSTCVRSSTTGRASPTTNASACSSGSCNSTNRRPVARAGPASACTSAGSSPKPWAAA